MNNEYNPFSIEMQDTAKTIDNSLEYNTLIDELSVEEELADKAFTDKILKDELSVDEDFIDELSIDEVPKAKLSLADAHIEAQSIVEPIIPTSRAKLSLADAHIEARPTAEPIIAAMEKQTVANESSLLSRVGQAYHSLQDKLADNQQLIQDNRTKIADLRSKIRGLAADTQHADKDEDELHGNKLLVQNDSCGTLIGHAEKIREHIYDNSEHAISLMAPLKASVDLLDLRLQYVRTLEQLLKNIKTGITLQDRLLEVDLVIESLATKLEVV